MPFWIPLASLIGGAGLGALKSGAEKKKQKMTGAMRAAEQRYGWASGQAPSTEIEYAGSGAGNILGGALGGLGAAGGAEGISGGLSKLFGGGASDVVSRAASGAPSLGGQAMAAELGQIGSDLRPPAPLGFTGGGMAPPATSALNMPQFDSSWEAMMRRQNPTLMGGGGGPYG